MVFGGGIINKLCSFCLQEKFGQPGSPDTSRAILLPPGATLLGGSIMQLLQLGPGQSPGGKCILARF